MSNSLAVATVTEALRLLIAHSVTPDVPFAVDVAARKPPAEPPTDPTITVFLYQVTPNAALRNRDTPTRTGDGTLVAKPAAALDLHYLISFYGDETQLVTQRLLGSVVRALHELPHLPKELIDAAAAEPFLLGSDLAASPQRVRFTPTPMDVDDASKLWSMLFQTPYALSLVYQGTAVLIESDQEPVAGKPVLRRTVRAIPSRQPLVDRLLSRPAGSAPGTVPVEGPVPRDHELVLSGTGLRADRVTARVGGVDVPLDPDRVRDDRTVVEVPQDLPPGVHGLQLLHGLELGDPAKPHWGLESNVQTFARQARIAEPVGVENPTGGGEAVGADLVLTLDMPLRDDQRVLLLLDERQPPPERPGGGYQFRAPFPLGDRPDPKRLRIAVHGVRPAVYLVRVQVDGVQSRLTVSAEGTFDGPAVDLTETH
ncbi:DUF4255 domain-containing protein [Wenjunlia tyrosinilytica]|uniref:Pvc16 N-terminal domain-containing protein n=1 Tax=Wenjunlia tyrosinilytica TaxID=1544741 RepID=A0A918E0K9_9ACTN|nr:DUF4255 domain-containing protein [Wenjunlia tyrosinilytica]GGO94902.1 hypothetical protein GCM10012280_50880 [Wenjunlia tyrosinilytica]